MNEERNDLQKMITQALEEIKEAEGENFDPDKVNLALVSGKTGLSRSRLRRIKANGFIVPEHGSKGKALSLGALSGYTGIIDDLLRKGITNSAVSFDRLRESGYKGSLSTVKRYISKHKDLVPSKRHLVEPQGNRGRRYHTGPGEAYQMDWGFVNVETGIGERYRLHIYSSDMKKELTVHDITWSRRDSYCEDQFVTEQPEESPTAPVKTMMFQTPPKAIASGFEKFNFGEGIWDE